jgi:hypothetical protein
MSTPWKFYFEILSIYHLQSFDIIIIAKRLMQYKFSHPHFALTQRLMKIQAIGTLRIENYIN